ncbi:MAG TPA: CDP-alcohol phosphatidyltransferase family protein, partial [Brumimicrobium sp.]|nr:CDP-alcohol phosphatidyltransferase family protein [Brumimicrobium sp.]
MFSVANIITGCNLLSGTASIVFAFSGRLELAVLAIILGAIFDFFDGFTARMLKQPSELGKQLDSLADMITFGVAPGVIVFVLLILSGANDIILSQGGKAGELWMEGTMGHSVHFWISVYFNDLAGNQSGYLPTHFYGIYKFIPFVGLIIPFFSLFRLAKFNLDIRQTTGFIGLPTPANSLFFASFALMLWDGFQLNNWKTFISTYLIQPSILIPLVVLFSLLLIAEIPLFSLKFKDFSWKNNKIRFIFLLFAIICIAALWVW